MHLRWIAPLLLAMAAPSGFSGSASGTFNIEVQVHAAGIAPPVPGGVGGPAQDGGGGPTTCSSASGTASVRVNCSTPTFVQISEVDGSVANRQSGPSEADACGQLQQVAGLTCVSYGSQLAAQPASQGVSLLPAETALRIEEPEGATGAATGTLYEIRRRDSLSTLVAVQQVDPDSRTVELLVTF